MEEDFANMSLAELRIYLRRLKSDVFPPSSHPRRSRVVNDINLLKTVTKSSAGMEAVTIARKSMKKPMAFEEVETEEGISIRRPVEALPTYVLPCDLRRNEKAKQIRRSKKVAVSEEPPTEIKSPVIPEKPKKGAPTKKEIPPVVAESVEPAEPVEAPLPSYYPRLTKSE
jgi:hypothetical protein